MEPEGSLLFSQEPTTGPYSKASWMQSTPSQPTLWRSYLILSSYLCLCLSSGIFSSGLHTNMCICFLFLPCMIHVPPMLWWNLLTTFSCGMYGIDQVHTVAPHETVPLIITFILRWDMHKQNSDITWLLFMLHQILLGLWNKEDPDGQMYHVWEGWEMHKNFGLETEETIQKA